MVSDSMSVLITGCRRNRGHGSPAGLGSRSRPNLPLYGPLPVDISRPEHTIAIHRWPNEFASRALPFA